MGCSCEAHEALHKLPMPHLDYSGEGGEWSGLTDQFSL